MHGAALTLLALLAAAAVHPAAAGCYRRPRTEPVPQEELYFNHQPAPQKTLEELPKQWDWNNVDGRSMLVGAGRLALVPALKAEWREMQGLAAVAVLLECRMLLAWAPPPSRPPLGTSTSLSTAAAAGCTAPPP